jgi:hypothetical protein
MIALLTKVIPPRVIVPDPVPSIAGLAVELIEHELNETSPVAFIKIAGLDPVLNVHPEY